MLARSSQYTLDSTATSDVNPEKEAPADSRLAQWVWNHGLRRLLRTEPDIVVTIGNITQQTSMFARVETFPLWRGESFSRKLQSLAKLRWSPSSESIRAATESCFLDEVFGYDGDLGPKLFQLHRWHQSQPWNFDALTERDIARAEALETFTILTRLRLASGRSLPPLNLNLADRSPLIAVLAFPMIVKIPVVSFQHFLEIHSTFAFNMIRRAGYAHADDVIDYLYELLFLQQKIAIALHEFVRLVAFAQGKKRNAALINAEVTAILGADQIFAYLKASLEKTVILVGLVCGATNLDSKKTHKAKLEALSKALPPRAANTPYGAFLLEYVKSEKLEELNSYRSGLLHKKGIADLQPHNFVGKDARSVPFMKIFAVLHEQHAKNTAVLLSALALLTDVLVELDPPTITQDELMSAVNAS